MTTDPISIMEQIVTGDTPELLVEEANKLAKRLTGTVTTTQIRRLFGTFRQIEMAWPRSLNTNEDFLQRDDAYRELILFSPRLEYQAQRHDGLRELAKSIKEGIKFVKRDDRKSMQRLTEFFEAVVAYALVRTEEQNQMARNQPPKKFDSRQPRSSRQ